MFFIPISRKIRLSFYKLSIDKEFLVIILEIRNTIFRYIVIRIQNRVENISEKILDDMARQAQNTQPQVAGYDVYGKIGS